MGQRTAIVLQHVNKYAAATYHKDEKNTRVFYHGWGIGRVLPSQLISILNGTLSASTYNPDAAQKFKPQGCYDITEEWTEKERRSINDISFDTPEKVGKIIADADNNNGGIFVRLTTNEKGDLEKVEYAYMNGYDNGGDYKSFCTFEEWAQANGYDYIDPGFKAYYYQVLAYFNAQELCNGEPETAEKAA